MSEYRWNVADYAAGFDAAAHHIHPYYLEMQQHVLELIEPQARQGGMLLDLGGGSGRLAALALERFPKLRAVLLDQSAPFLEIAQQRLANFGERATCVQARLQDDWFKTLTEPPIAITSMSAIHHLDAGEKRELYARCYQALAPGGILPNADEIRPASDDDYLSALRNWAEHKHQIVRDGLVDEPVRELLDRWEERNVKNFSHPRTSGDDCHETVAAQLDYLRDAGFVEVDAPWQRAMWAIMRGIEK